MSTNTKTFVIMLPHPQDEGDLTDFKVFKTWNVEASTQEEAERIFLEENPRYNTTYFLSDEEIQIRQDAYLSNLKDLRRLDRMSPVSLADWRLGRR